MPKHIDFIIRFSIFAAVHSLLASQIIQHSIQKKIGIGSSGYRLAYNITSLALFAWVFMAWQSTRVLYVAPGIWSIVMYGVQLSLLAAMILCLKQTGIKKFLGIHSKTEEVQPVLVKSGCYSFVRHPLYFISILFFLMNPVMTTRWLTLSLLGTIYFIAGAIIEERRLTKFFGTEYSNYQQDVPFLFPRLNAWKKHNIDKAQT